jgi:Ca2+-binding EF-hand superfamily protein
MRACARAVAFRIYDLNDSGVIEKEEVQRLLVALLQDNPAIDLSEAEIQLIVEQARRMQGPLSVISSCGCRQ